MSKSPIRFVLLHFRIRNDYSCPDCRTYFLSFHSTRKDALEYAKTINLEDEELQELTATGSLWVDEWVRRRNGDSYCIYKLKCEDVWDMLEQNQIPKSTNTEMIDSDTDIPIKYMSAQLTIDNDSYCPYNIHWEIGFHASIHTAREYLLKKNDEEYKEEVEDNNVRDKLDKLEAVYDEPKGTFRQIVDLELSKVLKLNTLCTLSNDSLQIRFVNN